MPLQEHVATVMKLAQIAYSDLPQANRERYTYDAFVQSVNDLGLHHQFLAKGVTTIESTLAEGEAYLLANHMHKNGGASRQVDMEPSAAIADPDAGPPTPANVGQLMAASKVAQLTDMLAKLVSILTPKVQVDTARKPLGPPAPSPGTDTPEWQQPRRVGYPSHSPRAFYMPLQNRFEGLPASEPEGKPAQTPRGVPFPPPPLVCNRRQPRTPRLTARAVQPQWVRTQPHGNSYFLPGKIAGKAATFLLDSGCTTNLISRQLFDTLSAKVRSELEPYDGESQDS